VADDLRLTRRFFQNWQEVAAQAHEGPRFVVISCWFRAASQDWQATSQTQSGM